MRLRKKVEMVWMAVSTTTTREWKVDGDRPEDASSEDI